MKKEPNQEEIQPEQQLAVASSIDSWHNKREEELERVRMKAESEWDTEKINETEENFDVIIRNDFWALINEYSQTPLI